MKRLAVGVLLALLTGAAGCQTEPVPMSKQESQVNRWLVRNYVDESVRQGVLAQQTLYPHHFVPHASALNDLGAHDFDVLATHYVDHPGRLNVRRGDEDDALYESRVNRVRNLLIEAGVDTQRVVIDDGLPGGRGAVAAQYLMIIAAPQATPIYPASAPPSPYTREGVTP